MIYFALIAYPEVALAAVTLEYILQLYAVWAVILRAFHAPDLFRRFEVHLTHHCLALRAVDLAAHAAAELILTLETCAFTCHTEFFTASLTLNETFIAILTPFALTAGGETVGAQGFLALFTLVQDVGLGVRLSARLAMDDTLRTAAEVRVALFEISPVRRIRKVRLRVDWTLGADGRPTPTASRLATIAKLFLTVFAEKEGFIICHFFIA